MRFLSPAWLGLAALAIPIILLYMLKLRRKQVQVSSTMLWMQLLRDRQANAPWQKLRRNLLLILQLLILTALVTAMARPALPVPAVASGEVIVLLDASASMNATDVKPTRFEAARRSVQTLVDGLSGSSRLTLILVGGRPHTLAAAETDKALLRQALSKAQVSQAGADWRAAFALAAGAAHGGLPEATYVIVSDGGLPESGLPALPGEVRYLPVGETGENLSISALALRAAPEGPELFAEVANMGLTERSVLLSIYLGEQLVSARQLDLPPKGIRSLTLEDLPDMPGVYRAHLSSPEAGSASLDVLPLDDTAFAIYQSASARRVLLVSRGNLFLEQVLASLPALQPYRALPAEDGNFKIPAEMFDLYIFDGWLPEELPQGNLLLINPPSSELFPVGEAFKETSGARVQEHALTRFVDWSNIHIMQARKVQKPAWAESLVEVNAGPLVFAGQVGGRRVAALSFDLRESDLPLQVAFPVLFTNLINYLAPPGAFDATRSLQPGEMLEITPQPGTEKVVVAAPSGQVATFQTGESRLAFSETDEPGYYAVNFMSGETSSVEYFAVNLFDSSESDLQPRSSLQVGRTFVMPSASRQAGLRELWPWLTGLALLILLIEWQAYHRRQLVTRPADESQGRAQR